MKKKISVLLAFVVLALSGCGMNNNPSGTERDKEITTASQTEKVTATTTVTSTTTAEVTTKATTAAENDPKAEKRFKVQEVLVSQLERSIEVDTFSFNYKAADGEAYRILYHGVTEALMPDNIYAAAETFSDIKRLCEVSENELSKYFDENGLILEKVLKLPRIDMYDIYSYEPNDKIKAYRLSKNWLISVDNGSVEFYEKNEQYTGFRNILELLWKAQNEFPDISITALTEITVPYEIKQTLIIVCSSDEIAPIGKYLTENGADLTGCLLLTPDEIQAKYDMYRLDKDVVYMYGIENDVISRFVNDDLYNRPDEDNILYGDDAWELVKERGGIDFPLPDEILNGPKYSSVIDRSLYCHDLYYDGTGFYSDSHYDARAIVGGIVRYIGRIDGLNSDDENVIILDENGHYWLYFQLDLGLNVKVGDTVKQFDVIGQTGSPGLYEKIRYAFRVI